MGLPILMMHMLRTTYLLIPRFPILMALSSSSTTTSSAASPPLHFPLQHYGTLGFGPWHGSCRTILITIIVIIMSRQSESGQSSLSPPPLHMSPYRPRQGAHAACYDRKKFYRLSGARSPQCDTQAALWIAELWWPGHIYLSPLLDNAFNLKIVHIFSPRFEQTCKDLLRGGILLTCEIGLSFWALGIKWLFSATSL